MPTFMRSQSGGRQSGGQRSKGGDRRGGPDDRRGPGGQQTPRKIITVPSMQEKVELKKSDNAWVRPDKLAASMDEETKALDVGVLLEIYSCETEVFSFNLALYDIVLLSLTLFNIVRHFCVSHFLTLPDIIRLCSVLSTVEKCSSNL